MNVLRRASRIGLAATCVIALTAAMSTAADAKPAPKPEPADYVIVDPHGKNAVETAEGTFMPITGTIDASTLIVVVNPDGTLPGGLTTAEVATLAEARAAGDVATIESLGFSADGQALAAPTGGVTALATAYQYAAAPYVWSAAYRGSSLWSGSSTFKAYYSFSVTPGTNQQATGQGLGYYVGYNGSQLGTWAKWYGVGIATDGSNGGAYVPWGNVLATAQFKAMSTVPHGAIGYFTAG